LLVIILLIMVIMVYMVAIGIVYLANVLGLGSHRGFMGFRVKFMLGLTWTPY